MNKISIREDFRRDGIAANFLANGEVMEQVSKAFPGSKINIGYPGICEAEYAQCKEILQNNKNSEAELSVVGHARIGHLMKLKTILSNTGNSAANIWLPVSNHFINQTIKEKPDSVLKIAKLSINYWSNQIDKPLDIALADCTAEESQLPNRVAKWTQTFLDMGYRNVIIADSRGIGTPSKISNMLGLIDKSYRHRVEFHPHDDSNTGIKNIEAAIHSGVYSIGTAIYKSGERKTMIDPRNLTNLGFQYEKNAFKKFEDAYKSIVGNYNEILEEVYGNKIIVTGTQYRLRNRNDSLTLKFGVTSDKYILGKMLKIPKSMITRQLLSNLKNDLYEEEKIVYTIEEIQAKILKNEKQKIC